METIGTTNDGEYLLKVTESEHRLLVELSDAIADYSPGLLQDSRGRGIPGEDLAPTFAAIHLWARERMQVTRLREIADHLEGILNGDGMKELT